MVAQLLSLFLSLSLRLVLLSLPFLLLLVLLLVLRFPLLLLLSMLLWQHYLKRAAFSYSEELSVQQLVLHEDQLLNN